MGYTRSAKSARSCASRRSVFASCPVALSKVADLARIRDHHGERRGRHGRDERGFVSAGGFEDDEASAPARGGEPP